MYDEQIKKAFEIANKIAKENPNNPEFGSIEDYKKFLILMALKQEKDYFERYFNIGFDL